MAKPKADAGEKKIRYAVVGAGYISQAAMLPAFAHAKENSELTAVISGDPVKLKALQKKYKVTHLLSYEEYDKFLASGAVDAVYIALPNSMHRDFAVRAMNAGVHVLCEKPMAVTEEECESMMRAAKECKVKLMIAYRLHFDEANLRAAELANSGKIGNVRIFNSVFTMQVKEGDIRTQKKTGGGTLYDIGVYCINAARYLFRTEPEEVFAFSANNGEKRFREIDEMTAAIMKFPGERLASFTTSFGAVDEAIFELVGTKGKIRYESAYEYAEPIKSTVTFGDKEKTKTYPVKDQFAPELVYFSGCILKNKQPEPSAEEGLADVRIIQALYRSAQTGRPVRLNDQLKKKRPDTGQEIRKPAVEKPELVHAASPHGD